MKIIKPSCLLYWKVCRHLHKYLIDTWFCIFIKTLLSLSSRESRLWLPDVLRYCLRWSADRSQQCRSEAPETGMIGARNTVIREVTLQHITCHTTTRNTFQIENTKQNYLKQQIQMYISTRIILNENRKTVWRQPPLKQKHMPDMKRWMQCIGSDPVVNRSSQKSSLMFPLDDSM